MELKGRLLNITRDIRTDAYQITLEAQEIPPGVDKLPENLRINLTRWTNKRSMSANAYYWVLVTKIAKVLGQSTAYVHNMLLMDYGTVELIDGQVPIVSVKEGLGTAHDILESTLYHLRPTSYVYMKHDGHKYRDYQLLKGSSLYDTEEMSQLIDGAVAEAKEMGIETLAPDELERMMKDYEEHYSNKH